MTIEEQLDLIHQILRQSSKLIEVELRARQAGEAALADQVAERFARLLAEVDRLRGRAAEAWGAEAASLRADIRRINGGVQERIRRIRRGVDVARDVVAVLAAVDDVVALLARIGVAVV